MKETKFVVNPRPGCTLSKQDQSTYIVDNIRLVRVYINVAGYEVLRALRLTIHSSWVSLPPAFRRKVSARPLREFCTPGELPTTTS